MSDSALGQFRLFPRDAEWRTPAGRLWRLLGGSPFFPTDGALTLEASRFRLYLEPGASRTRAALAWAAVGGPFLLPFERSAVSLRLALVAALKADPAVVAIVGDRVFPGIVPQTVSLPAIAYQVVSLARNRPRDLAGRNLIPSARIQISALSRSLSECEAAIEAVRQAIDAFRGDLGGAGLTVVDTIAIDERDLHEDVGDATARPIFRTVADYLVRFREPRPIRLRNQTP